MTRHSRSIRYSSIWIYYSSDKKLKKGSKSKDDSRKVVEVPKRIKVNNELCHNCRLRKPVELMTKCMNRQVYKPIKVFHVCNSTVARSNGLNLEDQVNCIVPDYIGDCKDFLPVSKDACQKACNRYYCHFCLRGSYDTNIENLKDKKDWNCPWCYNNCFCVRCVRSDQLLKLIAMYVHYEQNLKDLQAYLYQREPVLLKVAQFITVNRCIVKSGERMNSKSHNKQKSKVQSEEQLRQILAQATQGLSYLSALKDYFNYKFQGSLSQALRNDMLVDRLKHKKIETVVNNLMLKKKRGRPCKYPKKPALGDSTKKALDMECPSNASTQISIDYRKAKEPHVYIGFRKSVQLRREIRKQRRRLKVGRPRKSTRKKVFKAGLDKQTSIKRSGRLRSGKNMKNIRRLKMSLRKPRKGKMIL